ncbi:hypothetical protein SLE2022_142260 [Rubroshorea leprosula]
MKTPWPFHTWGLDLISPIHPPSKDYIWILVANEYFTKWVEAVPFHKATGPIVSNFIKEHIIYCFGILYKIDDPFIVTKAHDSGYYRLKTHKEESLSNPVNAKWLKPYYC